MCEENILNSKLPRFFLKITPCVGMIIPKNEENSYWIPNQIMQLAPFGSGTKNYDYFHKIEDYLYFRGDDNSFVTFTQIKSKGQIVYGRGATHPITNAIYPEMLIGCIKDFIPFAKKIYTHFEYTNKIIFTICLANVEGKCAATSEGFRSERAVDALPKEFKITGDVEISTAEVEVNRIDLDFIETNCLRPFFNKVGLTALKEIPETFKNIIRDAI
ncbi:MAG TPA: hypothetical protein DCL44_09700 [Elusimicrobia bacterium]|nr:hypothetical protein [Elusimicrobiota bacterium]